MRTSAILGWALSFALLVGIAGPLFGTCTQGDDDGWLVGLLIFAPLGLSGLALAAKGAKLGPHYSWLALPHLATLVLGSQLIPLYFLKTTIGGLHVCSVREGGDFGSSPSLPQLLWAPAWLVILLTLAFVIFLYWRKDNATQDG
jgi:hypothetical protein